MTSEFVAFLRNNNIEFVGAHSVRTRVYHQAGERCLSPRLSRKQVVGVAPDCNDDIMTNVDFFIVIAYNMTKSIGGNRCGTGSQHRSILF